jgi:putative membrane protein
MTRVPLKIITFGALLLAAGQAFAIPSADQSFATAAASGALAQVQMGQIAQQLATSEQAKLLGEQMVIDHGKANQELELIAKSQNLTLPTQPNSAQSATIMSLQSLRGTRFDKAYAEVLTSDHQDQIALFQTEAYFGEDPQLKAFAQKYLPVLQGQMQNAAELNKASLKASLSGY